MALCYSMREQFIAKAEFARARSQLDQRSRRVKAMKMNLRFHCVLIGRKSAALISTVSHAYSQRGAELMRVSTGHPAAPPSTPMIVSFA